MFTNIWRYRPRADVRGLQLFVPDVPKISLDRVADAVRLANLPITDDFRDAMHHFHNPPPAAPHDSPPTCGLHDEDVMVLLQRGLVRPIERAEVRNWVRCFSVPETSKNRRRFIAHPQSQNEATFNAGPRLASIDDLRQGIIDYNFGAVGDVKACFQHFALPLAAQPFFAFVVDSVPSSPAYALTTIPTGSRWSPSVAHTFT
ncbi:MAG: hypothetical protein EPO03_12020, partial [Porticoccaceae bacterium]